MTSHIEFTSSLMVGTVESVSPDQIRVKLDGEAPQATALNTGTPTPFPRVNSYVLMPNEAGATVAYIGWIGSEHAPYPKQHGSRDNGLIDLPFPMRKMSVSPVGTLITDRVSPSITRYELRRGVLAFPCVGDQVIMPTQEQLEAIVGGKETDRRVKIGTSPLATNTPIRVDPDKLFGRHLAVLGNTGSGKSCSVAGLIRWSLDAANLEIETKERTGSPNARFIVLDPNGEYSKSFADLNPRLFQVDGTGDFQPLKVPAWMWNGDEWSAFSGAAPGVQRPILFDAIRRLRSGAGAPDTFETKVRGRVSRYRLQLRIQIDDGAHMSGVGAKLGFAQFLLTLNRDFGDLVKSDASDIDTAIQEVVDRSSTLEENARSGPRDGGYWYNAWNEVDLDELKNALEKIAELVGLDEESSYASENLPYFFNAKELPELVRALATTGSGRDVSQFIDSLNLRIRSLFAGGAIASVAGTGVSSDCSLEDWLGAYIGENDAKNGPLSIIDLSLVPSEALHIVVAVLSRLIFEAIQRYRKDTKRQLPTVLVLDEAHTFAHKSFGYDGASAASHTCCKTFERIAREGRKFGLGLVLASQRPSEMSSTVLSQCNTYLLHRIVNDEDQNLVARLVPDNVRGLLRELPSLPSQHAILLGWATPIPLLVEMGELEKEYRPESEDPDFWDVWTREKERLVDWGAITKTWTETDEVESASESDV